MTKQKTGPVAVFQGLYVLWSVGVAVGLAIAGEWKVLLAFATAVVCVQGGIALVSESMTRREIRRSKGK